jgi:hypothetical protein
MKISRQLKIFWLCPEIRRHMVIALLYKALRIVTIVLLMPLIMVGATLQLLTYIGSHLTAAYFVVPDYLSACRQQQVDDAHSIISADEIHTRITQAESDRPL